MVGQTSQTIEIERQREAEMFKLFEFLTGGAANEANAYPPMRDVIVNKLTSTGEHINDGL